MSDIYQELLGLIGKDIEFKPAILEYVEEFDPSMRATVTSIVHDGDDGYKICFTFAKFEDYNRSFEVAAFFDAEGKPTLTAREAGSYNVEDYLYIEANWRDYIIVLDAGSAKLLALFMTDKEAQPDITYTAWLEAMVLAAMPHLKSGD